MIFKFSENFYFNNWRQNPSSSTNRYPELSSWHIGGFEDDCILVESHRKYDENDCIVSIFWTVYFSTFVNFDSMNKLSQLYKSMYGEIEFETAESAKVHINQFLEKVIKLKIFL